VDRFIELATVEEEKHLMTNLPILARALFGENSYLLNKQAQHSDWATGETKRPDGFIWLPWYGQLWVVEVEWKEGSNFFQQSRAFAKSRVDWEGLSRELRKRLSDFELTLNRAAPGNRDGWLINQIISQTKERHYQEGYLKPHCWVLLGHDGENYDRLRATYEAELKARFTDPQQYLLTMTRVFQGDTASYAVLTQHPSIGCGDLLKVEKSILVPVGLDPSARRQSSTLENLGASVGLFEASTGDSFADLSRSRAPGSCGEVCTYFDLIDAHKQKRISENILDRKTLWREFISKGQLTSAEFKHLSRFKPRAIAGFMKFLVENKIASRFGATFTLNGGVVPHIKRWLDD
jgi:hypothetical protein